MRLDIPPERRSRKEYNKMIRLKKKMVLFMAIIMGFMLTIATCIPTVAALPFSEKNISTTSENTSEDGTDSDMSEDETDDDTSDDDTDDDEADDEPTPKPSPKAVTRFQDKKSNGEYKILTRTKSGGTVTLQKPLKDKSELTIPATVKNAKKTYKVTNISSKAFDGQKKLKSVTIGKNVTTIGSKAFYNCTALREITLPAKVKKIGSLAFYNCRKMNELSIETKKLASKNIGSNAFYRTSNSNYKRLITDVPLSKLSAYTKLLRKKGMSPKSIIMPAGGNVDAYRPDPEPIELSKDFLDLTAKKSDSGTKPGTATVKLKQAKGVQLKMVTFSMKKQGIVTASIKGESNLSIKVKAKKQGSTEIILSVRYQMGRKTKTTKLTLGIDVT